MDQKITLSFNRDVILDAKAYAARMNISLSRLIEYLLSRITSDDFQSLEQFPIASWVAELADGDADYVTQRRSRKEVKEDFFDSFASRKSNIAAEPDIPYSLSNKKKK